LSAKTTIIVVLHNSAVFVEHCFESLERAVADKPEVEVLAIDNASTDGGAHLLHRRFPWVELIRSESNLGFAGGNNLGLQHAHERGREFVYLLNPDTVVEPDFLDRALALARTDPSIAAVQSLLLLDPERHLVDSVGNAIHFLGFGYCLGYRTPLAELAPLEPKEIAYASGAAVLLRLSAVERVGGFEEPLFLYHEDLDLGWKLRLAGHRIRLAPDSIVYHRHEFGRTPNKLYLMERNRWLVLLKNASARTLLVLAPLLAFNELAQIVIAWRKGWMREKLRSWGALLRPATWSWLRRKRRETARLRQVREREIAKLFVSDIRYEGLTGPFIERVANPAMGLAWKLARRLI